MIPETSILRRRQPPFVAPFNPNENERREPMGTPSLPASRQVVLDQPVESGPTQIPSPTLEELGPPPTMIVHNDKGRPVRAIGDDPVSSNMELIREQEGYKAPRSTKDQILSFLTGGIPGGIAYATDQNTRNRWAVGDDIAREEAQVQRDLGLQGKQAAVAAAKYRPVYQEGMLEAAQGRLDQGQQRIDQGDQRVSQGDRRLDQTETKLERDAPVEVEIDGQKFRVSPQIAARLKTAQSEGQKNRTARSQNTDKLIAAVASRQDKQIAASIAQLGDPQEMYAAASDIWQQASEAENEAKSMKIMTEADAAKQKLLLENAAKLKETTVKIQQEARKAESGRRVVSGDRQGRTMSQVNLERYAKDKNLTLDEARKKVEAQGVRVQ